MFKVTIVSVALCCQSDYVQIPATHCQAVFLRGPFATGLYYWLIWLFCQRCSSSLEWLLIKCLCRQDVVLNQLRLSWWSCGWDFKFFQCRGCRFNPLVGSEDPMCLMAKNPKTDRNNIVTNSIRLFKMVHIKKSWKKKKQIDTEQMIMWQWQKEGLGEIMWV